MSEPTTRNTIEEEAKRLAAEMLKSANNDTEWRIKQAETFARIEAKQDHFQFILDQHIQDDKSQFKEIKDAARRVSSSVGHLETDRATVVNLRDAAMILAKFAAYIIAGAWAVWLTFFRGRP